MSSLPPGCSDSDCEGYDPKCGNCGCLATAHYITDEDNQSVEITPLNAKNDFDYFCIEYNAKGEVVHACDSLLSLNKQCSCTEFGDFEFEEGI